MATTQEIVKERADRTKEQLKNDVIVNQVAHGNHIVVDLRTNLAIMITDAILYLAKVIEEK